MRLPAVICKILAVNKQCLDEALPVLLATNNFAFDSPETFCAFVSIDRLLANHLTSITFTYSIELDAPTPIAEVVNACPKLQHVTVRVSGERYIKPRGIAFHRRSRRQGGAFEELCLMRGLKSFRLQAVLGGPQVQLPHPWPEVYASYEEMIRRQVVGGSKTG